MNRKTNTRAAITALTMAAAHATSAPASADPTDLRSPDARDASTQSRSRTAAAVAGPDLRSIDARDAADAPDGAVTHVNVPPSAVQLSPDGFHWDDAAIGAGGTLGLVLILAGGTAAITRRHRSAQRLATS
jgi:hypothetical protein